MARLASVHSEMKDHAAALPLETQVLAARRRVLGNDDLDTLTAMSDLAITISRLHGEGQAEHVAPHLLDVQPKFYRGADEAAAVARAVPAVADRPEEDAERLKGERRA